MRYPHENVATVLVEPGLLSDLELELMAHDLWMWRVSAAPICTDGARVAFQIRHRLVTAKRGDWDHAADWTPVWISFGPRWRRGDDPLPWAAHEALWSVLDGHADRVRFHRRLGGVRRLPVPSEPQLS